MTRDDRNHQRDTHATVRSQETETLYPYPMSLSWSDERETSPGLGLKDGIQTYDVEAFAVDEEKNQPGDSLSSSNSLQSVTSKLATPPHIFDWMDRTMAHATAFDSDSFAMEQAFNEFDAILDEEETASSLSDRNEDAIEPETHESPPVAHSLEWDEDELAADVAALSVDESEQAWQFGANEDVEEDEDEPEEDAAALSVDESEQAWQFGEDENIEEDENEPEENVAAFSADEPWPVAVQFQLEENDITDLINNNPPRHKELKSQYFKRLKEETKRNFQQQYQPKLDDKKMIAAINQLWADASTPKITAQELKDRCWLRICLGGTRTDPEASTGYHWAGYEEGKARFRRVGSPTKLRDEFGIYQQKIQHKKTRQQSKISVTFFPDAWKEEHFNDLFRHFAQRKDFDPDRRGMYAIEVALNGDEHYIGMPILFTPVSNGEGVFIPVWSEPQEVEPPSEAQALNQPFSTSPDEALSPEDEIGDALDFDDMDSTSFKQHFDEDKLHQDDEDSDQDQA
jgi:hypothetical protein